MLPLFAGFSIVVKTCETLRGTSIPLSLGASPCRICHVSEVQSLYHTTTFISTKVLKQRMRGDIHYALSIKFLSHDSESRLAESLLFLLHSTPFEGVHCLLLNARFILPYVLRRLDLVYDHSVILFTFREHISCYLMKGNISVKKKLKKLLNQIRLHKNNFRFPCLHLVRINNCI